MRYRGIAFATIAIPLVAVAVIAGGRIAAQDDTATPVDVFSRNDHLLIARSLAAGDRTVSVLVAAKPGQVQAVRSEILAAGGTVTYEAAELDYLEAELPLSKLGVLSLNDITVANIQAPDQFAPGLHSVARDPVGSSSSRATPMPLFTLPPHTGESNVYSGTKDVGQPEFLRQHPTYDGRGVTVGILEDADLFSPFLQHGKDLQGNLVPKFVDVHMSVGPHVPTLHGGKNNEEFGWVDMRQQVVVTNGRFRYRGHVFVAPANGTYRVGTFRTNYPTMQRWYENLVHPHGTAYEDAGSFTVLWNQATSTVWVNTNQDGSLADDRPMHDYSIDHDVGSIPVGIKWGPVRGEFYPRGTVVPTKYPFIVKTDVADGFVWIEMMSDDHGTGVATSIAGDRLFGRYDGMAPGARLLTVDGYNGYSTQIDAMIYAARHGADLISYQSGSGFASNPGHNVWNVALNRLIDYYKIPIIISAGNSGPTIESVDNTPADSDKVFAAGGYTAGDRLRADQHVIAPLQDELAVYTSRGPRADGGFLPTFVSPTETLVGAPVTEPPLPIAVTRQLPMGYQVFGGTSQAAPMASGTIALLISAAKQRHIPYDPDRLRIALMSSARFLDNYEAVDQGAGLLDVNRAWAALQQLATATLVTDASGTAGIYERSGWHAGDHGDRSVQFSFTSSGALPPSLAARWIGNDGTFSSSSNLSVGSDGTASLSVSIHPTTPGLHSAILRIEDPATGLMIAERMCTIVASERLDAANSYTIEHQAIVAHPGYKRFFIDVPPGAGVLTVRITASAQSYPYVKDAVTASQIVHVRDATGDTLPEDSIYPLNHDGRVWQHAYPHPQPGVYEITIDDVNPSFFFVDPKQTRPLPPARFDVRISAFSARALATRQVTQSGMLQVSNTMAALHPRAFTQSLGGQRSATIVLSREHPRQAFTMDVPAGSTEVRAQIASLAPSDADVDVYLFSCEQNTAANKKLGVSSEAYDQGRCSFLSAGNIRSDGIASTAFPSSTLTFSASIPAGRWVAVVDAYRLSSEPVRISYSDTIVNPKYGRMRIAPSIVYARSGVRWTQPYTIVRGGPLPIGRRLVALPGMSALEADTLWAELKGESWAQRAHAAVIIQQAYHNIFSQVFPVGE